MRSGPVQDLLVAIKRAGKLTKDDMATLLVNYLLARKQTGATTLSKGTVRTWKSPSGTAIRAVADDGAGSV